MNAPADHAPVSLAEQARRLGVADRYHGFWGKEETVPDTVLQRAVDAMRGDGREPAPQHLGPVEAELVFAHRCPPGTPRGTWPPYSARWTLGEEITL